MAESTKTVNNHACPICLETFKSPRTIPSCKHSLCEMCLFTFVFNLKENGELDSTFECPVCRLPCKMSESGEVTLEWIQQTFPMSVDLIQGDLDSSDPKSSETERKKQKCESCQDSSKAVDLSSKKYCLDCQGHICDECAVAHANLKALKTHTLLSREDEDCSLEVCKKAQSLSKCLKHPDNVYELYCNYHEELMCLKCAATSHKECRSASDISDCSDLNGKTSELKIVLEAIEKHLSSLKQISKDNCGAVKARVKSYRDDLQTAKNNIIKRLNEVVDNEHAFTKQVIIDMEDKLFACTQKLDTLQSLCKKKLLFLNSITGIENVRPRELFVFAEKTMADVEELKMQIHQVMTEIKVANVDLKTKDVLDSINEKLLEDQIPTSSVQYQNHEHLPTLEHSQTNVFMIGNVEKHDVRLVDRCSPTYRHITVRKDGVLVLCDYCQDAGGGCGFSVLYDPQGAIKQTLKLKYPFCATPISETYVAVTVPNVKSIFTLYSTLALKLNKIAITKHTPKGIVALKNGNVAISWNDPPAFSISDISGTEIEHIDYFTDDSTGRQFKSFDRFAINEKRQYVLQPCPEDKAVYCFTFKQQPVFKYENNLKNPKGVSVDPKNGCVFVCDYNDGCIHQVSVFGKPVTVIRHDTLKRPLSVCYDGKRKCLWITRNVEPNEQILCFRLKDV